MSPVARLVTVTLWPLLILGVGALMIDPATKGGT